MDHNRQNKNKKSIAIQTFVFSKNRLFQVGFVGPIFNDIARTQFGIQFGFNMLKLLTDSNMKMEN